MPDFIKKDNGSPDWERIFMAMAMAALFFFQGYSQMQHKETKNMQAEHSEVQKQHDKEITKLVTREEIREMIEASHAK